MAKDRNTFAKRQREVDRKRKAEQKKERRARRKQEVTFQPPELSQGADGSLSEPELSVLSVFRKYLMTPGRMLCLGPSDAQAFRVPLSQLVGKGLLMAENYQGGYSLTESGFAVMKDVE